MQRSMLAGCAGAGDFSVWLRVHRDWLICLYDLNPFQLGVGPRGTDRQQCTFLPRYGHLLAAT